MNSKRDDGTNKNSEKWLHSELIKTYYRVTKLQPTEILIKNHHLNTHPNHKQYHDIYRIRQKLTQHYITYIDSNGDGSLLLFLLHRHLRSSRPVLRLEVVLPILAVLAQILLKTQVRLHPFQRIPQMVHIFVASPRPKTALNQLEVFVVELLPLLRIVDLQDSQGLHHLPRLNFVGALGQNGRNYHLKVGADGYQSAMVVVHVGVGGVLEGVFVALVDQHEVFFIDILIVFECVPDDVHVVHDGL